MELIAVGSSGNQVAFYQGALNDLLKNQSSQVDFLPLKVDGIFGENTKKAVLLFQTVYKLNKVDGIIGDETHSQIMDYLKILDNSENNFVSQDSNIPTTGLEQITTNQTKKTEAKKKNYALFALLVGGLIFAKYKKLI